MPTCEAARPLPARVEAGQSGTDSATSGSPFLAGDAIVDARPIARWEIVIYSISFSENEGLQTEYRITQ